VSTAEANQPPPFEGRNLFATDAALQAAVVREGAAWVVGQQLLRGPESDCGGSGAGALEGDLAEVQIL